MKNTITKSKKTSGITLIALIITIIVLLILAGVTIAILGGENGLLNKAEEARKQQEIAEIKEKIGLEITAAQTDAILRNEKLEEAQVEEIVNKYGTLQEDKDTIITKQKNYEISLKEIWYGVLSSSGSYTDKVKKIELLEQEKKELEEQIAIMGESQSEASKQLEQIQTTISGTTVTADKLLENYTAYKNGEIITGTMNNNGALNKTLSPGDSFDIPSGFTSGGRVTASGNGVLKLSIFAGQYGSSVQDPPLLHAVPFSFENVDYKTMKIKAVGVIYYFGYYITAGETTISSNVTDTELHTQDISNYKNQDIALHVYTRNSLSRGNISFDIELYN